jgi:cytosine/adenosine deaminase-related metal-dependent hydrolase
VTDEHAAAGPRPIDLLVRGGVVITVDAERRIVLDGAIAVDDGRIVEVGRTADVATRFSPRRTIDARGGAITPGFIDGHTHVSQHLGRGSIPDSWPDEREHEQWLPYWTHMTPEDDDASTMLACLEMVRNGTTAFSDLGGHFEVERKAEIVERVGLRGVLTEIAWDRPPHPSVVTGDTDATLRRLERVVDALPFAGPGSHAWGGVGIPGMGTASDQLLVEAKALADRHGLVFFTHASFADADTTRAREQAGGRTAAEQLDHLGILDGRLQLIHMIRTEAGEVPLLARAGTHVVHCPAASLRVGMSVSRVGVFPEMVAAGVNVALGSDSGNYSDFYDVGRQMYLAATIHREARGVMPTITAEQAVEMATINGARAIGAGAWLGSLEAGKQADLVIHRWDRPEWRPGVDPINSLVYSAQSVGVDTVIVGGEPILEGGRFTRVDVERELARIDEAARALNRRSGYRVAHRWPVVT